MKLVTDAKDWWKWNSVHVAAIISALPVVWQQLPPEFKALVPDWAFIPIGIAMFISMIVARVRAQS
jgi:hypothetical protein